MGVKGRAMVGEDCNVGLVAVMNVGCQWVLKMLLSLLSGGMFGVKTGGMEGRR